MAASTHHDPMHHIYIQQRVEQAMIGARADDPVLPERRRWRPGRHRKTAHLNAPRCAPVLRPHDAS
jgi:hypothetical protein